MKPYFSPPRLSVQLALISLLVLGLLVACGGSNKSNNDPAPAPSITPTFSHEGLDGHTITHLYRHQDTLLATTEQGLYRKTLGQSNWEAMGFDDQRVLDIAIIDTEHFLVSVLEAVEVEVEVEGEATPQIEYHGRLYESVNDGANWQLVETDFGGEDGEPLYALAMDTSNDRLYATGLDVLAVSEDLGRTWTKLAGDWGTFGQPKHALARHPSRGELWYGGQNAIEQMVLRRFELADGSEDSFADLLPSPAVIYGILFDAGNADRILVSGEGGIVESKDNGATWTNLLGDVNHRFYFQVAFDPTDSQTLITAGWTKNFVDPQPLILEVSTDAGAHWHRFTHPDTDLLGGVRSLIALTENDQTVVYLGLYGGGIMKATLTEANAE